MNSLIRFGKLTLKSHIRVGNISKFVLNRSSKVNHHTISSPKSFTFKFSLPLRLFSTTTVSIFLIKSLSVEAKCQSLVDDSLILTELKNDKINLDESIEEPSFPWKKFFLEYLYPEIYKLGFAIVWAVLGAIINMKIPMELGTLINKLNSCDVEKDKNIHVYFEAMKEPLKRLVALYLLQGFTSFAYISLLSNVGENIASHLRRDLFASYLRQDVQFFDKHKTGLLIDRLTSDVQDFKSSFKMCVSQGLKSSMQTAGCIISLYLTSAKMTIILAVALPAVMLTGTFIGSALRKISKISQQKSAEATAKANEVLSNFKTVRSFANEDYELDEYSKLVNQSCNMSQKLGFGIGIFHGLSNIALNGVVLAVIYGGGYLVARDEINSGQLMSFLVSAQVIQRSLTSLSVLFGAGVRGAAAGSRVFEFLNMFPNVSLTGGKKLNDSELRGNLRFENIEFTYPQRPDHQVLNKVNLEVDHNTTLALCGPSGSGKSTIASLLERFYDVTGGTITLDGIDIKELDPSWLRGTVIGYISQEPVLFSGSIADNIKYGNPDASHDQVVQAAKLSNAHTFIEEFPRGYDTSVGERGVQLSGGQKQRIAIARALLKNPVLLILDEATSALDAQSEKIVQQALDTLMKDRTTIVIAHRLSTIKQAQQIAVIKAGQVVQIGTHDELSTDENGVYKELIKLQQY